MANLLITGAAGFIGGALTAALQGEHQVSALDVKEVPQTQRVAGVNYVTADICDPKLGEIFRVCQPQTVVHLASVVAAGGNPARDYAIDVLGTKNVLEASLAAGARHIVVTSSGAAYGYHADNPVPLREQHALRGNEDFPYARHKRLVEEILAQWRERSPQLKQTVFRPCTVLGPSTNNQITALFSRPVIIGLSGTTTPFSLISETDVVDALAMAVHEMRDGVYNLAGDGTLSLRDIARITGKRFLPLPPVVLKSALALLQKLRITQLGAEHVKFVQYRPVLANEKLKREFGFTPRHDARAVFERYLASTKAAS